MKFDLFKKEDVIKFFRKIDGSSVGISRFGDLCPLHTYITHPDGMGITDRPVFVGTSIIAIGNENYHIIGSYNPVTGINETAWPNRFIIALDNQYTNMYGQSKDVTGDQAADVLEQIADD